MGKIIAFAGRIGSGKSELAKICQDAGFNKLYFALPLKQLIADLIHVKLDEINGLKNVEKNYKFYKTDYVFLSDKTGIPFETIEKEMSTVEFKTVRQLLQFIGTDLIRKYNTNWHVNKIREMIKPDEDYVIDDVRFKNELDLIKELGGDCWFVVRPIISNVSNHESEISLTWKDFGDKLIINDGCLSLFRFRWEAFFSKYDISMAKRDEMLVSDCVNKWREEIIEPLSVLELLELPLCLFKYKEREFDCSKIKNVSQAKDMTVDVEYIDGSHELIKNALNIEDLKLCL